MLEFIYASLPSVEGYLTRLGIQGPIEPTLENLHRLIRLHQMTVPFENMDCLMDIPVSLDIDHLYEKIVTNRRGGYCFELNGIFLALLRDLGYDAVSVASRVAISEALRPIKHRGILVTIDGKRHYVDVGLGGAMPPFAVELSEERQTRDGETYWVEELEHGWQLLRRLSGTGLSDDGSVTGAERNVVIFGTQAMLAEDFEAYSYQCWAMPDSFFRTAPNVAIRRENGYTNLKGDTFTVKEGSTITQTKIAPEDVPALLKKEFGIVLP